MALSVSLPIAWISLGKALLLLAGLAYLISQHFSDQRDASLAPYWTPKVILASLALFTVSLAWSTAETEIALLALVKHAKLIQVLLLIYLIRTAREAQIGVAAFVSGQAFLLASSWLLAIGLPVPWTTHPIGNYVVFSTYLDQSIMLAASAAVFWHLKGTYLKPAAAMVLLAIAAMADTLLLLGGRTGYVVALAVLSLAVMWAMPKRIRVASLVITPFVALALLFFTSAQVQERVSKIAKESQNYATQVETNSSSGWRLNAWQRSIEAIRERPWYGHGVGSWTGAVKRLQGESAAQTFGSGNSSNPHQEYLLWGTELGVGGTFLFLCLLFAFVWDARNFAPPIQRALVSVVAAMAVASLFNSTVYDALIGDFFCTVIGLLLALGMRTSPELSTLPLDRLHPQTSKALV